MTQNIFKTMRRHCPFRRVIPLEELWATWQPGTYRLHRLPLRLDLVSCLASADWLGLPVAHSEQEESRSIRRGDAEDGALCGRCPRRSTPAFQDSTKT